MKKNAEKDLGAEESIHSLSEPDHRIWEKELQRILSSSALRSSDRLSRLLVFLVEQTITDRSGTIKEYTIATEALGYDDSFDPTTNSIVRVHAGRLRRALVSYYQNEGLSNPLRIEIPKGSYIPELMKNEDWRENRPVAKDTSPRKNVGHLSWPRIGVLPFSNWTDHPDEHSGEHFVDGLGEELTAQLSRFFGVEVVAYYSMARFKGESQDLRVIGRDVEADFLITGSLRIQGSRILLTTQLSRTDSGQQVWSDKFKRELDTRNLFEIQDEIVARVTSAIADDQGVIPRLSVKASMRKQVHELSTYEAILRYHRYQTKLSNDTFIGALEGLQLAVRIEPEYAQAWALLSILYIDAFTFFPGEIDNELESGSEFARRAVWLDEFCQHAHFALCYASLLRRDRRQVVESAERIVELNPNYASMVASAGWFMAVAGVYERGIALIERGRELNPYCPTWLYYAHFLNEFRQGNYVEALDEAHRFGMPDFFWSPLLQATVLGKMGRTKEAQEKYENIIRLRSDFAQRASSYVRSFVLDDDLLDHILDGLTRAGLPLH